MKKQQKRGFALFNIALLLCLAAAAQAQVIPNAGQIIQSNQQHPQAQPQTAPSATPPPPPSVETNTPPAEEAENSNKTFRIDTIHIEGAKSLASEKVHALVTQYEHRDLNFNQLNELVSKLNALYHDQGLVTTVVFIPPQKIENNTVTLKAVEGVIGEVTYQPVPWWPEQSVLPRISSKAGDVFNLETYKLDLRRINTNPDFKASATLEAGKETGETDIHLKGEGHEPLHVGLFWDNLGRPTIGRQRAGIATEDNNLLGFGDRISNAVSWTRHSFSAVTHYEAPLGAHGTSLNLDHAYNTLKLGAPLTDLGITGNAKVYSGYIRQEVINTDTQLASVDLGFNLKNVNTLQKGDLLFQDRIRSLQPALNFDLYDAYGRTLMRHELAIGVPIMGSTSGRSRLASRPGAGSKFFRYTGSLTRVQRLPWNTMGIVRITGQTSPDRLASTEQFQAGGAFSVRGYLEGQVIGDTGWTTSAEWHVPAYIFPSSWKIPHTQYRLRDNIQLVTFADYGAVFVNKPTNGIQKHNYLFGIGGGVRANLTRFLSARLDLGIPLLRDEVSDNQYPRLHFGLESRLF